MLLPAARAKGAIDRRAQRHYIILVSNEVGAPCHQHIAYAAMRLLVASTSSPQYISLFRRNIGRRIHIMLRARYAMRAHH